MQQQIADSLLSLALCNCSSASPHPTGRPTLPNISFYISYTIELSLCYKAHWNTRRADQPFRPPFYTPHPKFVCTTAYGCVCACTLLGTYCNCTRQSTAQIIYNSLVHGHSGSRFPFFLAWWQTAASPAQSIPSSECNLKDNEQFSGATERGIGRVERDSETERER